MLERPSLPSGTGPVFAILATLTIGAVIASGEVRERVPAWLQTRVLLWLGQRSYGLYLYHTALILLFAAPLIAVRHAVAVPLWLITSVIVAEASYRFVERPVLVRGRRWLKRARPPV